MKEYDLLWLEAIKVLLDTKALRIQKIATDNPDDKLLKLLEDELKGICRKKIEKEKEDKCVY